MRVRAAKYSAPSSGVQTMTTIDLPDAANRSEIDRLVEREVETYGDDDIIDVDYIEDDGDGVNHSTLTPPQAPDEFSRDDRVLRYRKMMSGYSSAQFSARRPDDAMLVRDMDGYRRKLLA